MQRSHSLSQGCLVAKTPSGRDLRPLPPPSFTPRAPSPDLPPPRPPSPPRPLMPGPSDQQSLTVAGKRYQLLSQLAGAAPARSSTPSTPSAARPAPSRSVPS